MGVYEDVKLSQLIIWTDNPRISNSRVDNEVDAMKLIYEIVGKAKMHKLAKDISIHGLNMNKLPMVVPTENGHGYEVYDGNRRITIAKQFAVQSSELESIPNLQGFTLDTIIKVLVTDKEEALRIMEIDHMGEQEGKGQIPWESFERDNALENIGKSCMYPNARSVSKIVGLKYKRDFIKIPYTDIDSLFKDSRIKSAFGIEDWDFKDQEFIRKAYSILQECKPPYKAYSRYLKELSGEEEFNRFSSNVNRLLNGKKETGPVVTVKLNKSSMFENEEFQKSWIDVNVDGITTGLDKCKLAFEYMATNERFANIDGRKSGMWKITIEAANSSHELNFEIKKEIKPEIQFNQAKLDSLYINNTYNFNEFLFLAKDSRSNNCIEKVKITFLGDENCRFSVDESRRTIVFETAGKFIITASFQDQFSNHKIEIAREIGVKISGMEVNTNGDAKNTGYFQKLVSIGEVDFNPLTNTIIAKLNRLYVLGEYHEVFVAALRSVFETIMEQISGKDIDFTKSSGLVDKLLYVYRAFREKSFQTFVANSEISAISGFNDIKNVINLYTEDQISSLASLLNLGAHKSAKFIGEEKLKMNQELISHYIEFSFFYLKWCDSKSESGLK